MSATSELGGQFRLDETVFSATHTMKKGAFVAIWERSGDLCDIMDETGSIIKAVDGSKLIATGKWVTRNRAEGSWAEVAG